MTSLHLPHTSALIIIEPDQSIYLRLNSDGELTGMLADKYPDSHDALRELTYRMSGLFNPALKISTEQKAN